LMSLTRFGEHHPAASLVTARSPLMGRSGWGRSHPSDRARVVEGEGELLASSSLLDLDGVARGLRWRVTRRAARFVRRSMDARLLYLDCRAFSANCGVCEWAATSADRVWTRRREGRLRGHRK